LAALRNGERGQNKEEAVAPTSELRVPGGAREFWIEKDLLQFFYKKGWMHKSKAAISVKEVLERPAVIFEGLQREGQEEALCYAGIASWRFSNDGHVLPPPPKKTFIVHIREDGAIVRWDWEPADDNSTYPEDYRTRFGSQLWPKT
jgi:hypothetical protein